MTIEIGGGIGNLKQRLTDVVATDIQFAPWLDCVADAQQLAVRGELRPPTSSWSMCCITSSSRPCFSAKPSACCARAAASSWSSPRSPGAARCSTGCCITSRCRTSADPLMEGRPDPDRDPYASNQAIPTLIATRDRERFHRCFRGFELSASNGFRSPSIR